MEKIHLTVSIICNIVTAFGVFQYYSGFEKIRKCSKRAAFFCYSLFFLMISFTDFIFLYSMKWAIFFLSCFLVSFMHNISQILRLLSSGLLLAAQVCIYYTLIWFSQKWQLHLFAVPSFNASSGKIISLCLMMIFVSLVRTVIDSVNEKRFTVCKWLPELCIFLSILFIDVLNLILDVNKHHRAFTFGNFHFLSEIDHPDLLFYLSCFSFLVFTILVIYLCDRSQRIESLKEKKLTAEQQTLYYKNQISILNSSDQALRSFRHDIKNHLAAIHFIMNKEDKQAADYLDKMLSQLGTGSAEISNTGNILIDSLINYKFQSAASNHIKLSYNAAIPEALPFAPWDLTAILGNLVDNAIEATIQCSPADRYIQIELCYQKDCLIIKISNSYSGRLDIRSDGTFSTSKKDLNSHGIGLENVKQIVEKNQGRITFYHDENSFLVTVLLNS